MTLKQIIMNREGLRLCIYKDTQGNDTVYYGHPVKSGEVYLFTKEDAEKYLDSDIAAAERSAMSLFPKLRKFTSKQQEALIELVFNMGKGKIRNVFPKFVHNINIGDFEGAIDELKYADGVMKTKLSAWYNQVHSDRAEELI